MSGCTAALVAARQNRVLGMWCRKPFASAASIALAVGVTTGAIYDIVRRASAEGDPRAVVRPIREARRDRALDRWCREPFEGAPAIAASLGMSLGALHSLVLRARAAGDPRAVPRSNGHRRGGTWADMYLRLRAQGHDTHEIARISHRPVRAVRSTLALLAMAELLKDRLLPDEDAPPYPVEDLKRALAGLARTLTYSPLSRPARNP